MAQMPAAGASAVLHITAAAGGGSDRYVRDLAANTPRRHYVLHADSGIAVLEDVAVARFAPLSDITAASTSGALARWLQSAGVGILHLHGVDLRCRAHLDALLRARTLPYLVTLHDLQFVNPQAFDAAGMPDADPDWIVEIAPTLERAATVIAPSAFILDIALLCSPGIRATIIPPGLPIDHAVEVPATPADFAAHAPRHVVGVVGAVGPHKGSGVLEGLAATLVGSETGIVVIGYTDTQLTRGWLVPGVLYVHGAYHDGSLKGWLAAYGVETVLFPNRLPESFSYTLSEVWAAGLPVIVPDQGALGERVGRDGGGWLLPEGFDSDDAAALLVWLASAEGTAERARVISRIAPGDTLRVPTLEAMSRDTDALYARFGLPPADAADAAGAGEALAPLLAANLDGFAFRKELVSLAGEVEEGRTRLAEAQRWNEDLQRNSTAWATKLEGDIAALKQEIDRLTAETQDLARYKAVCDRLPKFVRAYLFERDSRARR